MGLDASWSFLVGDAAHNGRVFGRDIIFTSGPLASLYTRFYLPGSQLAYITYSTILVSIFCVALWLSTAPPRRYLLLALPIILANLLVLDAFFFAVPLAIVVLARHVRIESPAEMVFLTIAIAFLGIWPLVKGTFAIPAAVGVGAAITILWTRGQRRALLLLPLPAMFLVGCWYLTGQPLAALPDYIKNGLLIAEGYTEAMAVFDHTLEVTFFLCCVVMLLLVRLRRNNFVDILAYICICFVAFKASFVREHLIIGGTVLLTLSFMLILECCDRISVASGAACAAVAFYLCSFDTTIRPDVALGRFASMLLGSVNAIAHQMRDPSTFASAFNSVKKQIADEADMPPTSGTVDLYSAEQTLLLASGRKYAPRPIPQSYSAYTPELALLNKAHLEGSRAPHTIFFAPQPIDDRYPAIEDGPSWPDLLSRYDMKAFYGPYVVLEHRNSDPGYVIDAPILSRRARFGEWVDIPDFPVVWASMKFKRSLIGKIANLFWKTPPLSMEITYKDGHHGTFRIVPGMTSSGFVLSPTVWTAGDFVALRTGGTRSADRIRSISIHQAGGFAFSNSSYDLQVSNLHVPPFDGKLTEPVDAMMPKAGFCQVETVGGQSVSSGGLVRLTPQKMILVRGWALPYKNAPRLGVLRLALQPAKSGAPFFVPSSERLQRADVNAALQIDGHLPVGFTASFDLNNQTGMFVIYLIQDIEGKLYACPNTVRIAISKGS